MEGMRNNQILLSWYKIKLQKIIAKNEIINNCHITLNELALNNTVTINWVPGHQGYTGSERADRLAE